MRPWIVTGLVTAAVVGGLLLLTQEPGTAPREDHGQPAARSAPQRLLREEDVRRYVEIWPEIDQVLRELAGSFQQAREQGVPFSGTARARVEAVLRRRHLTELDWNAIRGRVEHVVAVERWHRAKPERDRDREKLIREKEEMLETVEGAMRTQVEKDLERLRGSRTLAPEPVHEQDLILVRRFWTDLDRLVPKSAGERGPD